MKKKQETPTPMVKVILDPNESLVHVVMDDGSRLESKAVVAGMAEAFLVICENFEVDPAEILKDYMSTSDAETLEDSRYTLM